MRVKLCMCCTAVVSRHCIVVNELTRVRFPVQMRLQRPTVSAEMSFMLAVTKFFVPGFALGGITPTPFQSYDLILTGVSLCCLLAMLQGLALLIP